MKNYIPLLFLFGLPMSLSAHAVPLTYLPESFFSTTTMPSHVAIHFSEAITEESNGIEIFSPDGTKMEHPNAPWLSPDARTLTRSVISKGEGVYAVSWHGVSAVDGHFTKGAFSFFYGPSSKTPEIYGGEVQHERDEEGVWISLLAYLKRYQAPLWSVTRMDGSRTILVSDMGERSQALRLTAYDSMNNPILVSPRVTLNNAKEGIGPMIVSTIERDGGVYELPYLLFTPPGEWQMALTWEQEGEYDVSATVKIDYPREIEEARKQSKDSLRSIFTVLALIMATVIAGVIYWVCYTCKHGRKSP